MKTTLTKTTVLAMTAVFALGGCLTNDGRVKTPDPSASSSPTPVSSSTPNSYRISSVAITSETDGYVAEVMFNASQSTGPISTSCSNSSGGENTKPCACLFKWNEVNEYTSSVTPIPHRVQNPVTTVQSSMVKCKAPHYYATEIPTGTTIKVSLVPYGTNMDQFTTNEFSYLKQASGSGGSFQDLNGNIFDNVLRYTCYGKFKRGMEIQSKSETLTNSANGDVAAMTMASRFCIAKIGDTTAATGCESLGAAQNSAQANYYNLYIRDSRAGDINETNNDFTCPKVKESLRGSTTVGDQGAYWPLDTTFSLSVSKSTDYPIGVEAFSTINVGNETSSTAESCTGQTVTAGSLVQKCLGYAAKPATDGTCPTVTDKSGMIHRTFRLRRFVAMYPPVYDSDGKMATSQPQLTDTTYILDRPVSSTSASLTKPYTMLGPKPCPFAYFDHKGVLKEDDNDYANSNDQRQNKRRPGYYATNNTLWDGKNVDGIEFPYYDSNQSGNRSCAAAFPLFNKTTSMWSIGTLHSTNLNTAMQRTFVRPIKPWTPYYVEDTNFKACAPQAYPGNIDPPLHFSKDSEGNVGWCAAVYPTQNINVGSLDKVSTADTTLIVGKVSPFTSPAVKNSNSAKCGYTSLNAYTSALTAPAYPGADAANDKSCGVPCVSDPLFAPPAAVAGVGPGIAHHPENFCIDRYKKNSTTACAYGSTLRNVGGVDYCYLCSVLTCDRTALNLNVSWPKFPLLAPAPEIESAISNNIPAYGCLITYDNKRGKALKKSPKQGCCGPSVKVYTGLTAGVAEYENTAAHLEPGTACLEPEYD